MAIEITSESHLQDIAEIADNYEEVTFSKVSFHHSEAEQFITKVKQKALSKLMRTKEFYEINL